MAIHQNRRMRPEQFDADMKAVAAMQSMADYAPANQEFAMERISALAAEALAAQARSVQVQGAADAARDHAVAAEWEFHNAVLGMKEQVRAQYGSDSDQVQALGLKKKSKYRVPARRNGLPAAA